MSDVAWTTATFAAGALVATWAAGALGYNIEWTAVGICLTAIIAVWQLRENSKQKAADRELETKREILFDGVRGMSQVMQAFGSTPNLSVPYSELARTFQTGMSLVTVGTSVASLGTARAGKEFTDKVGPLFLQAMWLRTRLEGLKSGDPMYVETYKQLVAHSLDNTIDLGKTMLRAIAAVRSDVGIAKETEAEFLAVVYPDEPLIRAAIDRVLLDE